MNPNKLPNTMASQEYQDTQLHIDMAKFNRCREHYQETQETQERDLLPMYMAYVKTQIIGSTEHIYCTVSNGNTSYVVNVFQFPYICQKMYNGGYMEEFKALESLLPYGFHLEPEETGVSIRW
jgi:hypothetical protein